MLDERDMQRERSWYNEQLGQRCVAALKKNRIHAWYVPERNEAKSKILELIPEGATVGIGDSVSLRQVGVIEELERGGQHQMFNPFADEEKEPYFVDWDRVLGGKKAATDIPIDEKDPFVIGLRKKIALMKKALISDVFLTGTNAITLDGKLVNVDGLGNRVAALIFGPEKVIVVVGTNKIVMDVDEALRRVKKIAAPINSRRHNLKHGLPATPCAINGICTDCRHPQRVCCVTGIIEYQSQIVARFQRLNVIIVGEELGI